MLLDRLFCPDWIMVMHFCLEPTNLTSTDFNASKIGQQSLFFCASKHDHATLYLNRLHWLPVNECIQFKILLYVFKCLNGHAPSYLASCFTHYRQTRTGLRSAQDSTRLSVPKFLRKSLQSAADKSFSLAAPALWNNLPTSIRTANSVSSFKRCLKTHLFPQ